MSETASVLLRLHAPRLGCLTQLRMTPRPFRVALPRASSGSPAAWQARAGRDVPWHLTSLESTVQRPGRSCTAACGLAVCPVKCPGLSVLDKSKSSTRPEQGPGAGSARARGQQRDSQEASGFELSLRHRWFPKECMLKVVFFFPSITLPTIFIKVAFIFGKFDI